MDPDGLDDEQLMRLIGLTLAVVWTHRDEAVANLGGLADSFVEYIKTGEMDL